MLRALTPVILLPISYFVFHEKVGWQAILGLDSLLRESVSCFWHNWAIVLYNSMRYYE